MSYVFVLKLYHFQNKFSCGATLFLALSFRPSFCPKFSEFWFSKTLCYNWYHKIILKDDCERWRLIAECWKLNLMEVRCDQSQWKSKLTNITGSEHWFLQHVVQDWESIPDVHFAINHKNEDDLWLLGMVDKAKMNDD